MNKKGFATLEAIASLFIVSLILVSSLGALINYRYQTSAANERIVAFQVGQMVQENITRNTTYANLSVWVGAETKTITNLTCSMETSPIPCSLFEIVVNSQSYSDKIQITFLPPSLDGSTYQILEFEVLVVYLDSREVIVRGLVYA